MRLLLPFILILITGPAMGQVKFSFATDVSGIRNFSPKQKFWGFGQTIKPQIHLNKKETIYIWLMYHTPGRFTNKFMAVAKDPLITPSTFPYEVKGLWNMKEFSIGWKHYFKGGFHEEKQWNLYGLAGFGLLIAGVENTLQTSIDTSAYLLQPFPQEGNASFRRLTVDLGIGAEVPMGADFFIYGDVRTYIPASTYPSLYLHSFENVPMPLMVNLGVRILFGINY